MILWDAGSEIGGVCHVIPFEASSLLIAAIGRSSALRGTGTGDVLMTSLLAALRAAHEDRRPPVLARIHPSNVPSLQLFTRHGFTPVDDTGQYRLVARKLV